MKRNLFFIPLFCLFFLGYAQDTIPKTKCKHLIYMEIFGIGGLGSVNYENNIPLKNKFALGFRGGFSTIHVVDYTRKFNSDLIFPLAMHCLYGTKHKIVMGVGQTISNFPAADLRKSSIHTRTTDFSTTFTIEYRYEHQKTGVFFGCGYTPIIEKNKHYKHWGGVTIGYAFK